ncbi:hypothetical protein SK803_41710 [Lentzea sp. BCCO 10_0856]|uniref:Integrase SAM-like N-terminal domain-containing protein n=1 Tax=Lentzea miocenica TaxID=3095431 RepID=A0ABU4TEZ1_9PSEU|nr:hypothetical protein [Lentzea sp. BCCO 10_0856]MDX8036751.1 hypothetical protein [Lentzea sp. BCCO 10_0856]
MTGKKKRSRKPSDGSVFKRGRKWAYAFPGPPHPLTGVRDRITKSGYETEDEAWDGMAEARAALVTETYVKPSRATINDFFEEYFPYARLTVEPTTAANYETLARTCVMPIVGRRLMQDFVPSMVAALYEHLLTEGRQKRNTNGEMYELWKAACAANREIRPREIADKVGVTYAAARRAVRRYEVGRIPKPHVPGLSPKTVKSVHIMLSGEFVHRLGGIAGGTAVAVGVSLAQGGFRVSQVATFVDSVSSGVRGRRGRHRRKATDEDRRAQGTFTS